MTEIKMVLRDATRDISFHWRGTHATRAVAALSADPVTMDELTVAMERFMQPGEIFNMQNLPPCLDDEPWDAGLVVIDLAAQLVVVKSTHFSPTRSGYVTYHDGQHETDIKVHFDLADEWMISYDADNWQNLAGARRRERERQTPLDARAVLFGRSLIEFLAEECFTIFPQRELIAQAARVQSADARRTRSSSAGNSTTTPTNNASSSFADLDGLHHEEPAFQDWPGDDWPGQERHVSPYYDTLKQIHIRWLMTPREDLHGDSPRDVLLAEHERRMVDMEHRCNQWSRTLECPRGLDVTSHAFRFGGFGTHEIVKYYDLVRELLWSCWDQLIALAQSPNPLRRPVSLALREFLTTEVPRLEAFRDRWLDTPDPEFEFHTPRSIIERERCRIPEAVSGRDAMIDPDCPCCQMLAELPGPMFWHLDGSGMDNDYAFDIYHRTQEEWEVEQGYFEDFGRPLAAEHLVAEHSEQSSWKIETGSSNDSDSIWSRSYSAANVSEAPLVIRLFCLGAHLAELMMDLRELGGVQHATDQLNRDMGNLRQVLGGTDELPAPALIEPVVARFRESLDNIAAAHPDLDRKCADLSRQLANFLLPNDPT